MSESRPESDAVAKAPPPGAAGGGRPPRSYLGWSMAAAVLCFLPLGLVALWYGVRTSRAVALGDAERSLRLSRIARRWLVATVIVGLLAWVALALSGLLLGAFSP